MTTHLDPGMAMNVASSAECLVDDALAYAESQTEENRVDFIASCNILIHRAKKALQEMGEDNDANSD